MNIASLPVRCTLNGDATEFLCRPHQSLLEVLRDVLGHTGSKNGCSDGNCGACSILLEGRLVNSCLVLAAEVEGKTIVTVEGLAEKGRLDVIQQAFIEEDALQCGICTPGMVMACRALLDRHPDPTDAEIRLWLAGNLCRCTGYETIIRAVKRAALIQAGASGDSLPPAATTDPSKLENSIIGSRPPRKDGRAKVTGAAIYGADFHQTGALVGLVLRSPHAHANIRSVDTSAAESLPGVRAVITSRDLPQSEDLMARLGESVENYRFLCDNTLASAKALYVGHPIAAVAAVNEDVAREALARIKVDFEVLPAVTDVRDAIEPGAPLLHENLRTDGPDGMAEQPSNIATHSRQIKGDPIAGFAEADLVIEREYRIETVHQGYIEPQSTTAVWNAEGQGSVTVYTTTQGAFDMRGQIVQMLKLPEDRVRVVPTEMGGGFGGKVRATLEIPAVMLSRKSGRPVKMTLSRTEVLLGTGPSPAAFVRVKLGAAKTGRLVAAEASLYYEGGGYPGAMIGAGVQSILGSYDIPHARIDAYDVVVNKPMVAAYRAPCAPQASFAGEQAIDEIATGLKIDPLQFRLMNTALNGTELANGVVHAGIGCREVLEALRDHPHARSELTGPHTGRGVAVGCWGNWGARSSCKLDVLADGTVSFVTGSVDVTGTRTSLAMQVAEVLEIPLDRIRARFGHTDEVGFANTSAGSRTTVATGVAVLRAAGLALDAMKQRAATLWDTVPGNVTYSSGRFTLTGRSEAIAFSDLAAKLPDTGGIISTVGDVNVEKWGIAFAAHMVDVKVDPETGKVEILRYTAVQDVGRAIHPLQIEGQIRGGVAQGIGWALYEGYDYNAKGQMMNASLLDYRMPTAMDVPSIETVIIEVPFPDHPLGSKGVGEAPIIPPLGAIANAIFNATGRRVTHAPMTSRHVLEALDVIEPLTKNGRK
ncbi:MAG: molybdopterin-dependent oxidoreductase [Opitutaceae bacterium]